MILSQEVGWAVAGVKKVVWVLCIKRSVDKKFIKLNRKAYCLLIIRRCHLPCKSLKDFKQNRSILRKPLWLSGEWKRSGPGGGDCLGSKVDHSNQGERDNQKMKISSRQKKEDG